MKALIVRFLDRACSIVDNLPNWTYNLVGRWIGCPRGMNLWACQLMDRWNLDCDEVFKRTGGFKCGFK